MGWNPTADTRLPVGDKCWLYLVKGEPRGVLEYTENLEGETNCVCDACMHALVCMHTLSCMSCILRDLKRDSFAQSKIMLAPSLASAHASHGSTPAITYPSSTLAYNGSPTLRTNNPSHLTQSSARLSASSFYDMASRFDSDSPTPMSDLRPI